MFFNGIKRLNSQQNHESTVEITRSLTLPLSVENRTQTIQRIELWTLQLGSYNRFLPIKPADLEVFAELVEWAKKIDFTSLIESEKFIIENFLMTVERIGLKPPYSSINLLDYLDCQFDKIRNANSKYLCSHLTKIGDSSFTETAPLNTLSDKTLFDLISDAERMHVQRPIRRTFSSNPMWLPKAYNKSLEHEIAENVKVNRK